LTSAGAGPARPEAQTTQASAGGGVLGKIGGVVGGLFKRENPKRMSTGELAMRSAVQSAARSIGTQIAKEVLRGVLGGISR
jgi:hypothetical protein